MKLKNKKTGKIVEWFNNTDGIFPNSLAELNEEWEDYEEPTTYYYISDFGAIREGDVGNFVEDEIVRKQIGNYFETKEEAEKAVGKLKAWKRLRYKGFRFVKVSQGILGGEIRYKTNEESEEVVELLNLLFGGEE